MKNKYGVEITGNERFMTDRSYHLLTHVNLLKYVEKLIEQRKQALKLHKPRQKDLAKAIAGLLLAYEDGQLGCASCGEGATEAGAEALDAARSVLPRLDPARTKGYLSNKDLAELADFE